MFIRITIFIIFAMKKRNKHCQGMKQSKIWRKKNRWKKNYGLAWKNVCCLRSSTEIEMFGVVNHVSDLVSDVLKEDIAWLIGNRSIIYRYYFHKVEFYHFSGRLNLWLSEVPSWNISISIGSPNSTNWDKPGHDKPTDKPTQTRAHSAAAGYGSRIRFLCFSYFFAL